MIRIRELREAQGLQQKELAIDLGVTQPTISGWESGVKVPSARNTQRIANYFNVSIDYLLGRADNPQPVGGENKPTPANGDGLEDEKLNEEFMLWFRQQSPARQKEVLFDLAKAVTGHEE